MSFSYRPARRNNVPLLIGLAGGTGSGKTLSAFKIAKGLSGDQGFAVLDTENGRALEYADKFSFDHRPLHAPFRPESYAEAVAKAAADQAPVIVIDSGSHAYAGEGGLLDWHEEELQRMAGDDYKKREAMTFSAWVKPKQAQKRFVSQLLQVGAHVIVCLRAEEKIEIVKENGKTVVRPKKSLVGADGWVPVCEKNFAYEMTLSLLFTADARGVPKPIKLNEAHAPFVPLDRQVDERVGEQLAGWAAGGSSGAAVPGEAAVASDQSSVELGERLLSLVSEDKLGDVLAAIEAKKATLDEDALCTWLARQVRNAESVRDSEPVAN